MVKISEMRPKRKPGRPRKKPGDPPTPYTYQQLLKRPELFKTYEDLLALGFERMREVLLLPIRDKRGVMRPTSPPLIQEMRRIYVDLKKLEILFYKAKTKPNAKRKKQQGEEQILSEFDAAEPVPEADLDELEEALGLENPESFDPDAREDLADRIPPPSGKVVL